MKSYLFRAVSVISLLAAGSASAHDDGWYLRGNAGYGIHQDTDVSSLIDSSLHGNGLQSEGQFAYSGGVGYDFGDHWRVELDADHLETDLGAISQTDNSSADLMTDTLMLNALYDFDDFGKFEPYVGAGIGLVRGKANLQAADSLPGNVFSDNPTCVDSLGARALGQGVQCAIADSDTGIGWQLLAGLGYKISDNLTWDTHYTYLNGPDLDLNGHIANISTGAFEFVDAEIEDIGAHTLMTGFRYRFGHDHAPEIVKVAPPPPPPPPPPPVIKEAVVPPPPPPPTYECWDRSVVFDLATCPVEPPPPPTFTCPDGTITYDLGTCPAPVVQRPNLNLCGESSVAIFDVPVSKTPKQMPRLGTLPEFGDSHGLSPDQFFNKLNARYNDNATDKAYLNYLFKSMGYSNGWADAQSYMFSEEVLPVGTRGLLGLGKQHHFEYSILPTNDRDRQAFRIQSANGSVVHFMKTCGNYMYACE